MIEVLPDCMYEFGPHIVGPFFSHDVEHQGKPYLEALVETNG